MEYSAHEGVMIQAQRASREPIEENRLGSLSFMMRACPANTALWRARYGTGNVIGSTIASLRDLVFVLLYFTSAR